MTDVGNVLVVDGSARALASVRGPVLRELVRRGNRVVACASLDRNMPDLQVGNLDAQYEGLGVPLVHWRMNRQGTNPVSDLFALGQLVSVMRAVRPGRVLAYSAKSSVYASVAARITGIPAMFSVMTGLGFLFETGGSQLNTSVRALGRVGLASALRRNRRVIFQNPDDRDLFLSLGLVPDAARTAIVAGSGVDLNKFAPARVSTAPFVFLMIARIHTPKGVAEFIEAATMLRAEWPNAHFRLLGPFDDHPSAISPVNFAEMNKGGAVEYLGATNDVRPYLASCSVFVLPSYREGVPRTSLEAMAVGRAIVTTDTPGCRETVVNGTNGVLVPPRDAKALASAMRSLLADPSLAVRFGEASRRVAEERFADVAVAKGVVDAMAV